MSKQMRVGLIGATGSESDQKIMLSAFDSISDLADPAYDVVNLSFGRDFLIETVSYDVVILFMVFRFHRNELNQIDKKIALGDPTFLTSQHHSQDNWRKRLISTGAKAIYVSASEYGSEVDAKYVGKLPGYTLTELSNGDCLYRKSTPNIEYTVEQVERAIKLKTPEWRGHCHEVSAMMRSALDLNCRLCYGHWFGNVAAGSYFAESKDRPFQRHGWLEMPDGTIIDPTRWIFENIEPYIFHGPNNGEYDEGADIWRQHFDDAQPIPKQYDLEQKAPLIIKPSDNVVREFIVDLFDRQPEDLNFDQVFYLANLSRKRLGAYIKPIYQAIVDAGYSALIPIDNLNKVIG